MAAIAGVRRQAEADCSQLPEVHPLFAGSGAGVIGQHAIAIAAGQCRRNTAIVALISADQ
jgi:hypothetical protein